MYAIFVNLALCQRMKHSTKCEDAAGTVVMDAGHRSVLKLFSVLPGTSEALRPQAGLHPFQRLLGCESIPSTTYYKLPVVIPLEWLICAIRSALILNWKVVVRDRKYSPFSRSVTFSGDEHRLSLQWIPLLPQTENECSTVEIRG